MAENSKYRFFRKLTKKYRLVILNDRTFEERIVIKITPLLVIFITLVIGFLVALSSFGIINNLTESPSSEKNQETQDIIKNYKSVDSLKLRFDINDLLLQNIQTILSGGIIGDTNLDIKDVSIIEENINLEKTERDNLFSIKIEGKSHGDYISNLYDNPVHFFPPLLGTFTEKYNISKNHFGIDIVNAEGSIINSIADGVVVINNWTKETGFVIGVQHSGGFLSFYKHNSKNLKDVGDFVKIGEGIAVIGSSGELSSGPHLHFELWKNGESVNPENYILF